MRLEVPAYLQEEGWTCLPACVRMCMAAIGDERPESSWTDVLAVTLRGGTLEQAWNGLVAIGVDCEIVRPSLFDLEQHLAAFEPVILGVLIVENDAPSAHAVVLVGVSADGFLVNDPSIGAAKSWDPHELATAMDLAGGKALVMPPV